MYIPKDINIVATPAARWTRIMEVVDRKDPVRRPTDDWHIQQGIRFFSDFKAAGEDDARQRMVYKRYPNIYAAFVIYEKSRPHRNAIEALIMCNTTIYDIAGFANISSRIVYWYEKLYFDVREQCKSPGYMMLTMVPEIHNGNVGEYNQESMLKIAACMEGGQMVADMIGKCIHSPETDLKLRRWVEQNLTRKIALATCGNIRVTGDNLPALAETAGISKKEDAGKGNGLLTKELGTILLKNLERTVANRPSKKIEAKVVNEVNK
jgi:hypothetical protein